MQAILFDNDGTLVNTRNQILASYRHATAAVLHKQFPDEVLLAKIGLPLADQMWDFTSDPFEHELLLQAYRSHQATIHDAMISLYPDVKETLAALVDRGFLLGVVTSKLHALAFRGLSVLGITSYFSVLVGADDCEIHKPHGQPLIQAAQKLGISVDQTAYVGDAPFDIQAAQEASMTSVAALWGIFDKEALEPFHPTYFCPQFSDLLSLEPFQSAKG